MVVGSEAYKVTTVNHDTISSAGTTSRTQDPLMIMDRLALQELQTL